MGSERFNQAIGRLETAIERLESLASTPSADGSLAALNALEERHRRLREGTSDALARLDRLIGATPAPASKG